MAKKVVMLYFSGTGNSKYIAELFCKQMNAACHSIEEDVDFGQMIKAARVIAFCYPIYGSRVPRIMREFAIKHMDALKGKKVIIFCTQMGFSGDGARAFTDIFPRNHFIVRYAEHFLMPNNVNNLGFMPLATEKEVKKYLDKAEEKMNEVCVNILNGFGRKRGFNPLSRALGLMQGIFFPLLEWIGLRTVWIDKDCTLCDVCVSICPVKNFENIGDKIVTKKNCTMCFRCINKCPQKAISIYHKGKVKRQFEGV
jgi:ferredoxin